MTILMMIKEDLEHLKELMKKLLQSGRLLGLKGTEL